MSEIHNTFHINGNGNTVAFHQDIGDDSNVALEMILKFFMGVIVLLLSPVILPVFAYKLITEYEKSKEIIDAD